MKEKKKSAKKYFLILCGLLLIAGAGLLFFKFEGKPPQIELQLTSDYIGANQELSAVVKDTHSGIRKIWVGLLKDGKEVVLFQKDMPATGLLGGDKTTVETLQFQVEPRKLGVGDGPAMIRMVVRDFSWRRWWHGNQAYLERSVTIDTQAPRIDVLTRVHNVNQGGAGVVVYRLSEQPQQSGVRVGDQFFPGIGGFSGDVDTYVALFALAHDQKRDTPLSIEARDLAGNVAKSGFPYHLRRKKFKQDTIRISDRFLNWKMPEFSQAGQPEASPLDTFLRVNRQERRANYEALKKIVSQPQSQQLWQGAFSQLPNAANRAGFADHRRYYYNDKKIDEQDHLGIDLASVAHSPVPAANAGIVAFSGELGIYGRAVVIDHGLGLFSMYAHLSQIEVQKDQAVKKDDRLGRTGRTGMAGGDHLHFSVMVHHTFVNPLEWLDGAWIRNNYSDKLTDARAVLTSK